MADASLGTSGTLIAVVVPLYNKAPYILRCLRSIQDQTLREFEAIIVDDGSTDGGYDIAAQIADPRFLVLRQENRGSGAARNTGIRAASADIVAFLDSDDRWEPGFLQAILDLSVSYPQAHWFATAYRRYTSADAGWETTMRARKGRNTQLVDNYLGVVRHGAIVSCSSVAVHRDTVLQAGAFLEGQPIGEDQELWVRLAQRSPLAFDSRPLAIYHSEAMGRVSNREAIPANLPAVKSLRSISSCRNVSDRLKRDADAYADWLLLRQVVALLYEGNRTHAEAALRQKPFRTVHFRWKAGWLHFALRFLPVRLATALALKPPAVLQTLRNAAWVGWLISAVEGALFGNVVLVRPFCEDGSPR